MHIPEMGRSREEIFESLRSFKSRDMDWRDGKVWCYVYSSGQEAEEVTKAAYMSYLTENGLDPTVFPSMLKLETDVVKAVLSLLRGGPESVGHVTTGGTESIMLAVKTARDMARARHPHITQPEMVLPRSAHGSFHKAAHYLSVKPRVVEIDTETFQVRAGDMQAAINENTILLVGSAPSYSQGVIDPIREIGAIALEKNIPFHVDACVGGVHLSVMRQMGLKLPDYDFGVPGVTSISTDLHKYGYAAKGCSVIMYRNKEYRKYQLFACTETTCYTLINTTILSSKSGGPMAGAWAVLNFLGQAGYQRIVGEVQQATKKLIEGINAISGLRVLGKPAMSMFSFASETVNVYVLADEMAKRGWFLQPQFATPWTPRNLHISVNFGTTHQVDQLLSDLRECTEQVKKTDTLDSRAIQAMVQGALQSPNPEAAFAELAKTAGLSGTALPKDLAFINEVMEALPNPLCNEFLINFFNDLYA